MAVLTDLCRRLVLPNPGRLVTVHTMTRQVIWKALAQRPFRRFSMRLTDGRRVQIKGEHTAAVHPKGDTMIVFDDDGGYRIIDIALVTELQTA